MPLHLTKVAYGAQSLEELVDDPHHWHNGFFREVDHPSEGRLRMMGSPTRWNHSPLPGLSPAPRLGQHSREILRSLGVDDMPSGPAPLHLWRWPAAATSGERPAAPRAPYEAPGS